MQVEMCLRYVTRMMHRYEVGLRWDGCETRSYASYTRQYRLTAPRKPAIVGSADPAFRGDPTRHNPEELLVAALAACHMLSYLALCARHGIDVRAYEDAATGRMAATTEGGRFEEVVLKPRVTIAGDVALARDLHARAHAACYIASSCNFPVRCEPVVELGEARSTPVRRDLAVRVADRGALAVLGETLGHAGISVEGGGAFGDMAHFLVEDAERAAQLARAAGIDVLGIEDVVTVRLDQERPGQLGAIARAMADAGVTIRCMYSDHDHQLILCVDDRAAAARVAQTWSSA